ncbi:putative ATP-dependent RNA helicase TDRD12 [Linepithema humile]|uniref:putative ATP-dependent RNA helicase TDRD12 n=1 Tax=Linepithema humile TaxID=83485 RepID=UPI00351F1E8A
MSVWRNASLEKSVTVKELITHKNQKDYEVSKTSTPQVQTVITCLNGQVSGLPTTARPIKVMSIHDPHIMRVYELGKYEQTLEKLMTKLWTFFVELKKKNQSKENDAKIGDMVFIVRSNYNPEILPTFICRGVITHIKKDSGMYYVLLVDHGTTVELTKDKFCIVPQDFISDNKYLTKTVGVHNILPTRVKKNEKGFDNSKPAVNIVAEWSEEAIQFTKNVLVASKIVYFDHLLTDEKNDREYGEFYCVIDDDVITLSKALIINYHAIYLEKDLLQLIDNPSNTQQKENTGEHIIHTKFSNNMENSPSMRFVNEFSNSLNDFCLSEKILIHGTTNCGVFNDISDLNYPSKLHESWHIYMKSLRPTKLQSYMWPAINKGLNVVGIGSSQCGKTSGCVMAVCGLVAMRQKELSRSTTPAPLALILCSSSFEVINVHSLCASFLYALNDVKSVAAVTGKTDRSIAAAMYSGCQILVSTPRYLVRFLNNNKGLLSFDRLFCLVLDNVDVILDKYYNSLGVLFKKHNIIKNREPQGDNRPILQTIISATKWTSEIKKFVRLVMCNPYICIASFLEAVVFKSVRPKVYKLKSTYKNQKIADILKNDYKALKTMIICINAEEAKQLNASLLSTKETLLVHENMTCFDVEALRTNWEACVRGLYPVLICTDAVLSQLNCIDIEWLIHHSVQLKWKNAFNYRFSVLLKDLTQDTTNSKVSIIVDETNNVQLSSIISLMQRMKVVITPELLESIERIAIALERDKKYYALCDNVKSFGFCQSKNVCEFRHCILPKIDAPITNIQINDKVKLIVRYIHDTTHFSARIIDHIPQSNEFKKITFSNVEYMQITCKMQQYYQNIENRKMCASTNMGDICVLEESIDIFKRVQIRRVRFIRTTFENAKFVDVRCIDSGIIHENIDARKLLDIPEELLNLSTHIVEVFLAGIAPYDEEYTWNHFTNEAVHKWFSENFDERSYIIGKVRLHLGNTIWLDDFEIGTKLINHADVKGASLRKELINGNFAVLNDTHIPNLLKLYKNSELIEVSNKP